MSCLFITKLQKGRGSGLDPFPEKGLLGAYANVLPLPHSPAVNYCSQGRGQLSNARRALGPFPQDRNLISTLIVLAGEISEGQEYLHQNALVNLV